MTEGDSNKIQLTDCKIKFLSESESDLAWDYSVPENGEKRDALVKSLQDSERYTFILSLSSPLMYNFLYPLKKTPATYSDLYADPTKVKATAREFITWIKEQYKLQKEEDLCLTEADELYKDIKLNFDAIKRENLNLMSQNTNLIQQNEDLRMRIEDSNAKDGVSAIAEKKGIKIDDEPSDKDGLKKAQRMIFEKPEIEDNPEDGFEEDELDDLHEEDPEPRKEINNWKAMYFDAIRKFQSENELKDAQFKTLLEIFNSREND